MSLAVRMAETRVEMKGRQMAEMRATSSDTRKAAMTECLMVEMMALMIYLGFHWAEKWANLMQRDVAMAGWMALKRLKDSPTVWHLAAMRAVRWASQTPKDVR